jgi:hypothetical protein
MTLERRKDEFALKLLEKLEISVEMWHVHYENE